MTLPPTPSGSAPGQGGPPDSSFASAPLPVRWWKRLWSYQTLRDVSTLVGGTSVAQAVTLLGYLALARLYHPADFGVLSIITSIAAVGTVLATGRYDQAIMLPEEDARARQVVRATISVTVVSAALVGLGCAVATWGLWQSRPALAPLLGLVAVLVLTNALTSVWTFWLSRSRRYRQISYNRVQSSTVSLLAQLGFWGLGWAGAAGLTLGRVAGVVVSTITLGWRARDSRRAVDRQAGTRRSVYRRYRKMPLLNGPAAVFDALRLNGINLFIGFFYSATVLGQFSLAWQLVQAPLTLINGALAQVYFRQLARTKRGHLLATVKKITWRCALIGVVPFALLAVLAPWLFPLLFGPRWVAAGQIARGLTPWLFVNLVTSPISTIFVTTEKQQISLVFSLFFMACPLGLIALAGSGGWPVMNTVWALSLTMATLLALYIVLAYLVARAWDRA